MYKTQRQDLSTSIESSGYGMHVFLCSFINASSLVVPAPMLVSVKFGQEACSVTQGTSQSQFYVAFSFL